MVNGLWALIALAISSVGWLGGLTVWLRHKSKGGSR